MEEKTIKKMHSITVENRKRVLMTGVDKVIASSATLITLYTSAGGLNIVGSDFKINSFNETDGSLNFEGNVNSLKYSGQKTSLLKKIFK